MTNHLNHILSGIKGKQVIVWGDFILDEYIYTTTGRISREAPVLVTEFESNAFRLGGAGNVVQNIKALGAVPLPVGFVGNNNDGTELKMILQEIDVSTDYLIQQENYRTPKKSRILSGAENTKKQQVLRIDTLNNIDIPNSAYTKLENNLTQLLEQVDHMIISDYIFQSVRVPVWQRIREKFPRKTVIIDSRYHLTKFKDISIATPNESEVRKIFPGNQFHLEEDFHHAGHQLLERLNAEGIILKRGHKGMIIFSKGKKPQSINIHGTTNIVDVTGAGDTVISVISLALAAGATLPDSAKLANTAAGFVVMKEGAYPITNKELQYELG